MIKLKKIKRRLFFVLKALFDRIFALAFLLLLSPLFFLLALGVRLSSRGPIFFRQVRLGRGMEPFLLYKFRTMATTAPRECASAALVSPSRYITPFGAFLRKTSLDELPQLCNVLRGEMSFFGPRPVILSEGELISRRVCVGAYTVRPGLSGLSQVRGRDLLNDEEKARLDGIYVRRMSLSLDLLILFSTVFSVLCHRGVREGAFQGGGKTIVRKRI